MKAAATIGWLDAINSKATIAHFTGEKFGAFPIPIPPPNEQADIVRFLEHADRRIRRYISAKQKLIKLLEEQKRAIIHRAVTRGIDPNARLKPSGVDWLGDVPAHWEVLRLGRLIADGPRNGVSPPVGMGQTVKSFSISVIRDGRVDIREGDIKYVSANQADYLETYDLREGDLLLVRGNGTIGYVGKVGRVMHDIPGFVYPDLLMRIRLAASAAPAFVVAVLNGPESRTQLEVAARTSVGTFKVNNWQVRQLWLALPPRDEQINILRAGNAAIQSLSLGEDRARRSIDHLNEYRVRLIADIVTGKLDVRAARNLFSDVPDGANADIEEDYDAVTAEAEA